MASPSPTCSAPPTGRRADGSPITSGGRTPGPPTPAERERDRRRDDLVAFEENYKLRQLWSVDVASGAEQQLTSGNLHVASYRLSPDGTHFVVERARTPLANDEHTGELWIMRA